MKEVILNNEVKMPIMGLGTWKSKPQEVYNAVRWALKLGITHFDCAFIYENEEEIGQALMDARIEDNVRREDLFVVSKLWNNMHNYEDVEEAIDESLKKLKLNYVDLYLMHWPVAQKKEAIMPAKDSDMLDFDEAPLSETWRGLENVYRKGKCKAIGVSNFGINKLKKIMEKAEINPMVNQVECHPYLRQDELLEFLEHNNIVMTAYSPIGGGNGELLGDEVINEIARKNNATPAEVCLAWNMKRGVVVIPKSVNEVHIRENIRALNIELDDDDMDKINEISINKRFLSADVFKIGAYENDEIFD